MHNPRAHEPHEYALFDNLNSVLFSYSIIIVLQRFISSFCAETNIYINIVQQ